MADQIVTTQTTTAERIGEIAFDMNSISVIVGLALDKLSDSDCYGHTDTENGAMMADIGQVMIDVRQRLGRYSDQLHGIQTEVEGGAA